ncbi:MAG TPA: acetoin utilization protein AcuC [Armatimonadota bacterium]
MQAAFIYSDAFADYDLGPSHPLRPERYRRTFDLLEAYRAFSPECPVVRPRLATEEELLSSHDAALLGVVKAVGEGQECLDARQYGFCEADNPQVRGLYEASRAYTGASVAGAELLLSGRSDRAFNPAGGLHHAMRNRVGGFCTFNDCAVAIHRLLEGFNRVAYIDIDAHHGDGVEALFWDEPRVLTISTHESGQYLFPGTGFPEDLGSGDALGTAINLPLAPGTTDEVFLWAFGEVVPPLLQSYQPDAIVTQMGADAHHLDPLAHLGLTTSAYDAILRYYDALEIPWLALGGGGYNQAVVPRVWSLVWAHLSGRALPDELPEPYRVRHGGTTLRDHFPCPEVGPGAWEQARQSVGALKEVAFPLHGLSH